MEERIKQELELLHRRFPDLEYVPSGHWIKIPRYLLPAGWNQTNTDIAFQVPVGYPGTPPYGIYVPSGMRFKSTTPGSYSEPAGTQPPFGGSWGVFSWTPAEGEWRPTAGLAGGSNLLNWILSFADRFREGI